MPARWTEYLPLSEIARAPRNPKRHDQELLEASMAEHGFVESPAIDERTGRLVAGHGRLDRLQLDRAAGKEPPDGIEVRDDGEWLVPVGRGWASKDDVQAERYLLVSNQATIAPGWEVPELVPILEERLDDPLGLDGIGFTRSDFDAYLDELRGDVEPAKRTDPDEVPPVPEDPVTERGDVWLLGKEHRLVCGDSTDPAVVAVATAGERARLCFTSPPYSDARDYEGGDLEVAHLAEFLPAAAPLAELVCVNLGILRRNGAVLRYWDHYIKAAEAAGLKLLSWNVWDRGAPYSMAQQTAMFPIEHEWVLVFGEAPRDLNRTVPNKTAGQVMDTGNRQPDGRVTRRYGIEVRSHRPLGTVVRLPPAFGLTETGDVGHPAMFPVALPTSYLEAATKRRDLVLDCFGGGGTTMIAAHQLGRRSASIELAPAYCDVILRRFEEHTGEVPVLERTGTARSFAAGG